MKTSLTRAAGLCALLASTSLVASAMAQTPPAYRNLDANGVDLTHGGYVLNFVEGSIGSGEGELAVIRRNGSGQNQWDGILLERSMSGSAATIWVSMGLESDKFTGTISSLTPAKANGGSLSAGGGGYIYRAPDGGTIIFADPTLHQNGGESNLCNFTNTQSYCRLLPTEITEPNGKTVYLEWNIAQRCENFLNPDGTLDCDFFWRPGNIDNSHGYGLYFSYAAEDTGGPRHQPPSADWYRRTAASFYNAAVSSSPQASIGYAYPSAGVTNVTDPAGRTWRFTEGSGTLGIRRPGASTDSIIYSGSGNNISVTRDGVTTQYSRSLSGSTATMTVTNALNQQAIVVSDMNIGRPTSIADPLNRTTSFQYDGNGRLTRMTQPEGNYVQLTLDGRGNVTQTQAVAKPGSGAATITASATFAASCADPSCNQPLTTTDARGNVTDYTYDATHGGLLTVTAPAMPNGVRPQTRYSYTLLNGEHRLTGISACQTLTSCAGTGDEVKATIAYDINGNVTSVTRGDGSGALTAVQGMTYDELGNLLTVDGPLSGSADTIRMRYNAARELVGTISSDPDGAGALKHRAVRHTIDAATGLLTKTEAGTVNSQSDGDWAAFAPLEAVEIGYDSNARPVTQKLVAGGTAYALTQASYDTLGRVECSAQRMNPAAFTSLPSSACTLGTQGSFGPDRIAKTVYDAAGQVTKVQSAYGTSEQSDEVTATYSNNGQTATVTDAENNKTTYEYDGHDRLAKTFFPVATKGAATSSSTDYEQLTYDAASNVVSRRVRDGQSIGYTYDNLNRLVSKDLPNSLLFEADLSYAYDNLGRLTQANNSQNVNTSFTYDALGRKLSEGNNHHGATTYQYDLAGRRTRMTWKDGFFVDYDYHTTGEMTAIRENGATSGVGVLATFAYDDLGRRGSLTRGNGLATLYTHDPVSRLATYSENFPGDTFDQQVTFAYNPASQITNRTGTSDIYAWIGHGSGSTASTANGLNQLAGVGGVTPTYDAKGNMTSDGVRTFGYTAENILHTVNGGAALAHDALGRLYYTSEPISFAYDGSNMIAELQYVGGHPIVRRYVHGPGVDEPLVWYEGSGTSDRRFLHADERGSIVMASLSDGTPWHLNRYDEHGVPASNHLGRFGYTGQAWLPELGLHYYKARMYHPKLGRFMQTDPIGYGDGMNLYNYVGSDPVNFTDPSGLQSEEDEEIVVNGNLLKNNALSAPSVNAANASLLGALSRGLGSAAESTKDALEGSLDLVISVLEELGTGPAHAPAPIPSAKPSESLKKTLSRIAAGQRHPHRNDGSKFRNDKHKLPQRPPGYYKEYVHPTPGVNPGPQRVVIGRGGETYYSPDHYDTFFRLVL